MINKDALFSDETANFKQPYEPEAGDAVRLILRTLANDVLEAEAVINGKSHKMAKFRTDATIDYYTYTFKCPQRRVAYYFTVTDEDDRVSYNRLGCVENVQAEFDFSFVPGFRVPDWAKSTVFYQIFPYIFCN